MPTVSIIIPIYNVGHYIEQCLESMRQQTFTDYEVLLVDDCGSDDSVVLTERFIEEHGLSDKGWKLLRHTHNRGLSAARNTGMVVAVGEYVLFVDSDDFLSEDCLELLIKKARDTDANVVCGAFETFGEGVTSQVGGQLGGYVMAWNKLCRRSFLLDNDIHFIEGLIHEDNPWNFEISVVNQKFASVSEVTYHYRIRENSLQTHHDYQRHFEAYCRILQAYTDIIRRRQLSDMCGYLEQQKALYFTMTLERGTPNQLRRLYRLIRTLDPKPAFSKADAHYCMPEAVGFYWYKKFHKYHLC